MKLTLLFLAASLAFAQQPTVYQFKDVSPAPQQIHTLPIPHPNLGNFKGMNLQCKVVVLADGSVQGVTCQKVTLTVLESDGGTTKIDSTSPLWNQSIVDQYVATLNATYKKFRYTPGLLNGNPVAVSLSFGLSLAH